VKVLIRVSPGSRRRQVGGRYGDAEPPVLIVRVTERAVDGRANEAAQLAVAEALGVPRSNVRLLSGGRGRLKTLDVTGADEASVRALLATES
jgi:uncharacterized protein